jgi:hypothetical protein
MPARLALMSLRTLASQATNTRRRLEPATAASLAVVVPSTAEAAKPTATVTSARPRNLFLRNSQESTEPVADHNTPASLTAETTLCPLWAETAGCAHHGDGSST